VSKPRPIGQCALCLKTNKLLANSHIISEFNYAQFYNNKHQLWTLTGDGSKKEKPMQKGIREHLLCDICETKLSKWETHATRIIGKDKIDSLSVPSTKVIVLSIDYAKFKLYGMSLIWRLAVTNKPSFAIGCLGMHQEKLRQAIFSDNPLTFSEFPFYIEAYLSPDGNFYTDWMHGPMHRNFFGKQGISIVIGGLLFTFVASSPKVPQHLERALPVPEEQLMIPVLPISTFPEFETAYRDIVENVKRHSSSGN
jgi:hypothetical protein